MGVEAFSGAAQPRRPLTSRTMLRNRVSRSMAWCSPYWSQYAVKPVMSMNAKVRSTAIGWPRRVPGTGRSAPEAGAGAA
jgi:hypothetical protein